MVFFSNKFIKRTQEISDSPRSNLDICDFERESSAKEVKLTCFPFRNILSVFPKEVFIKFPLSQQKIKSFLFIVQ